MLQFQGKFGVGGRYPKNPQTRQYILSKQLQEADLFGKVSGINVTQKASRLEVTFDKVPLTLQ